ncbi:FAD-dependent oxidoreductase [Zavarzinia compransoris]|uniref:FAD-dependent oxidoreductase 2 FAD-binding domain-containing protein n=1 Tax=Zavarzinia compransoris TaxID=1264899 RepID=A0A317E4B7_9PROT|nr:FAD-dependent oxidoreductase [Zavarzinia compransoris]PWR20996.1 hypothetical protein DKG75_13495 [Zavarzinia compransoris]TDP44028.1 fumarate reductase flavoprotein subunit [Zavarzinia compransoris]
MSDHQDLVVVGAGLAGLAAAIRAAEDGLAVTVLEAGAEDAYLCNSRYTGGLFHIAMDDMAGDPAWVLDNLHRATHGETDPALAAALTRNARRTLDWLRRQGIRFIKAGPDGLRRNSLAPPGVRQTGLHWQGRAGDVMLRTLGERLARLGGQLHRGAAAGELILREGAVAGVIATIGGVRAEIPARAVVLADGGFQADMELMRRFISPAPEKLLMRNAGSGRGAGLRMAEAAGAALRGMDRFYGHIQYREALTDQRFWPYPVLDSLATAGLVVDGLGRRFCDEGLGGVYITNEIARLPDPAGAWIIFDAAIWQGPGTDWLLPANPYLLQAGGRLTTAATVPDLAAATGLPAAALAQTLADYNAAIAAGQPEAQGRSAARYKPWPILKAPFHAVPIAAGVTYTMGGIAIDAAARVLDGAGQPIPGLFAAGSCTGGLEGGSKAGYSGGLSKAAVFGLIAGETAAATLAASLARRA